MTSVLRLDGTGLVEHLGAAKLRFELTAENEKLHMRLVGLSFLRIPCPAWLMPRIVAEESEQEHQNS